MYIKELELENFKNFSEKKIIDFYKGLNVIAGFGGTGKTNILESIYFVFGKHFLKIDNNNFFNEISAPSKVKLTLDNNDTLQRVLKKYPSEVIRSNYYINDKLVKKEQVQKYFDDLNLTVIDDCGENLDFKDLRKYAFELKIKAKESQIIVVSHRSPILDAANYIVDISNILQNLRFLRLKYPKYL